MDSQTRQEYVRAAISFLQNPKLVDSPLKDKLRFLKDKGLSDMEVDEALSLALSHRHQSQGGRWNFILILGICIGGYKLYQAYLEQQANKKENEQKSGKTSLGGTQDKKNHESIAQLDSDHPTLSEILKTMSELKQLIELQRSNFKTEIQSLRTLLLGHEKFAAPPKIPEWQLASTDQGVKEMPKTTVSKSKSGGKKSKAKDDEDMNSDMSKPSHSTNGFNQPKEAVGPSPG